MLNEILDYNEEKSVMENVKESYDVLFDVLVKMYLECPSVVPLLPEEDILIFEKLSQKDTTFLLLLIEHINSELKKEYVLNDSDQTAYTRSGDSYLKITNDDFNENPDIEEAATKIDIDRTLKNYIIYTIIVKNTFESDSEELLRKTNCEFLDKVVLTLVDINLLINDQHNKISGIYDSKQLDSMFDKLNDETICQLICYITLLCCDNYEDIFDEIHSLEIIDSLLEVRDIAKDALGKCRSNKNYCAIISLNNDKPEEVEKEKREENIIEEQNTRKRKKRRIF